MKTAFEIIMKIKGYKIDDELDKIQSLKLFSDEKFNNWQNKKKWKIFNHHFKTNTFYNNFVGNQSINNWQDIPIMQKSNYQDSYLNLLSLNYNKKNIYVSNTSGSSGHPFFFAKNKESHSRTWAYIKNRYSIRQKNH